MAISACNTTTDHTHRELAKHGSPYFPIACYQDDLNAAGIRWHWHEEFEYAIAVSGISVFLVENIPVQLRPGDAIFINSQVLHAVERSETPETRLHSAVFHHQLISGGWESIFWEKLVRPLLQDCAMRYVVLTPEIPWQAEMLYHLHGAWDAMAQEPEDYKNLVRYRLSAALRLLVNNCLAVKTSLSSQERVNALRVRGMLEFIHANYPNDITMKQLSQSVNSSNSVCLRCFHLLLGTTPIQYLKNYRLEKAAQMLKTTSKTAKDIALACGFHDISYFTKSFREKMGYTPKEYQQKSKNNRVGS